MLFGQPDLFAIEIGQPEPQPQFHDVYIRFRFWITRLPVGDSAEQISLSASTRAASLLCDLQPQRRNTPFAPAPAATLFQQVYDAWFSLNCFFGKSGSPDLRTLHHLDPIAMGATRDQYGLILVATTDGTDRLLAKDLNQNRLIADQPLPQGSVESTLSQYIAWAKIQLQPVTASVPSP